MAAIKYPENQIGAVAQRFGRPVNTPVADKSAGAFERVKTLRDALEWGTAYLRYSGLDNPFIEAQALMSGLLRCSPTMLHLRQEEPLASTHRSLYKKGIERRANREPMAYILGVQNFLGFDFRVDPSVLIPRPETELLVEMAAVFLKQRPVAGRRVLEIGAGSGCIAVSLAQLVPEAQIVAVEVSEPALSLAAENTAAHKVQARVQFLPGSLYSPLGAGTHHYFDMIVSNPPYISASELKTLDPDLSFEPRLALDGGENGLAVIEPLVRESSKFLRPGGFLMLEIGYRQGKEVSSLMKESGFSNVQVFPDLNGHDRIVIGKNNGSI